MGSVRRFASLVLLVAVAAAASAPAAATASSPTPASPSCFELESFDVEAKARRSTYRIGQTAVVTVWVRDKLTGLPEGDVHAVIGVQRGLGGLAKTDENGRAVVRVPLRHAWAKLGRPRAVAWAWHDITPPVCYLFRYGERQYPYLFRILP